MKKITLLLMISIGLLISCKKETGPTTKTEKPAQATIAAKTVVDTALQYNTGSLEFGQKLYFSKNGNISKLGCKMASKGNFRVSFWDFTTKNLIAATTITVTDTTLFTYNTISSISVVANTRYVVSINNTDGINKKYYDYARKSNTTNSSIYPFSIGSVTFEAQYYKFSAVSVFPDALDAQYVFGGLPDMQFEYTE